MLLAQLSGRQLQGWMDYYACEPWGELRADFRAGQLCAAVANYAGKVRNADVAPANPADFMPALAEGRAPPEADGPRLLSDSVEHSKLLRRVLFHKDE